MFSLNTQHINYRLSTYVNYKLLFLSVLLPLFLAPGLAQEPSDSLKRINISDSTVHVADSLMADTLSAGASAKKKNFLEAEVKYSSDDSISISLSEQKIYLYKNAAVDYQNIDLKADYLEFNLNTKIVSANGVVDTSGTVAGKPIFTQGSEEFNSDTMQYNFDSHKGLIKYIVTKQGEGFLHSERTKRLEDGAIDVSKGKYTTCDSPHPHFYIRLTKAIVIPEKKIVSGPAYMVVEDIPLPLALPFGFFPNTTTRSSGLLIPTYGEEQNRGFYLRSGGWYFVLGDHVDFTLLGSLYSRGSWGLEASSVYRVRYRYSGKFNIDFMINKVNDDPFFSGSRDFKVMWTHTQDPKANPNRKISANVNFSTNSYEKNQSYNINEYLTNTKTSSISYAKTWPGSPFNLTANIQQSQSSRTHMINLMLPTMAFNMTRVYPFRKKTTVGKPNWLENIQISYNAKLQNQINAKDSGFFSKRTLHNMKNGFAHSVPISLENIKLLKIINISPSISYNGVLYTSYLNKRLASSLDTGIYRNKTITDTIRKITYAHSVSTALGISVSPKIYGMFTSKNPNSHIIAVRHVMTPSASFSFSPDMSGIMPNYYRKIVYPNTISLPSKQEEYSVYQGPGYIYGTPSINRRSGSLSLSLNNNLEMKVRTNSDSTDKEKKVSILDNFNFNTSYNPFVNEFHWTPVNMNGSTKIFNKQMDIQFGATFNPYALDSTGRPINRFLINENGRLFRLTQARLNMGFNLKSAAGDKKKSTVEPSEGIPEEAYPGELYDDQTAYHSGAYVDFDIPWSINVDYSWSYTKQGFKASYTHTVRLNGDISITPKWKVGLNSGYDLVSKKVTTTNFSINRDLHCWEMRFSVVPFGDRRSYSFTINAKSTILRDVKYNKSRSWYDNF